MRERIIYLVNAVPGGQDGRDHTDKGGLFRAFYLRPDAEALVGKDTRYEIVPAVVDVDKAQHAAVAKLSPVDLLVLGISKNKNGKLCFIDPNAGHNER